MTLIFFIISLKLKVDQGFSMKETKVFEVFSRCVEAIYEAKLITKVSKEDKEFHFQNWCQERFKESSLLFDTNGRNSYPDFTLVEYTEGYEIKGLAYPGRELDYDSNSQVPNGYHNGRSIYYIFGRYPKQEKGNIEKEYPVIDLVICHGNFLNADHEYVHKNDHIKGFGSYGDIMIRDRKMYVAPTPFAIADGLAGTRTLIIPSNLSVPSIFKKVGDLIRTEADHLVIGYEFDLLSNNIKAKTMLNPNAGKKHYFSAYRLMKDSNKEVKVSKRLESEDS